AGTDSHGQANVEQVIVQSGNVYWITHGSNSTMYTDGGVYMCPTSGCSAPTTVSGTTPLSYGTCILSDSTYIYYVANGSLYRCPLGGCPGGATVISPSNVYPQQQSS